MKSQLLHVTAKLSSTSSVRLRLHLKTEPNTTDFYFFFSTQFLAWRSVSRTEVCSTLPQTSSWKNYQVTQITQCKYGDANWFSECRLEKDDKFWTSGISIMNLLSSHLLYLDTCITWQKGKHCLHKWLVVISFQILPNAAHFYLKEHTILTAID